MKSKLTPSPPHSSWNAVCSCFCVKPIDISAHVCSCEFCRPFGLSMSTAAHDGMRTTYFGQLLTSEAQNPSHHKHADARACTHRWTRMHTDDQSKSITFEAGSCPGQKQKKLETAKPIQNYSDKLSFQPFHTKGICSYWAPPMLRQKTIMSKISNFLRRPMGPTLKGQLAANTCIKCSHVSE